jgi:hypothetical protein
MARKYLQMGFTRARRYANYKGGKNMTRNMITSCWKKAPARMKKRKRPLCFLVAGKPPKLMTNTPVKNPVEA